MEHHGVPIFDPTINIGNIVTIVIGVVTLTIAWVKLGGRLGMLEYRADAIEKTLDRIAALMTQQLETEKMLALLQQEIASISSQHATLYTTVEGMRRGEGFVTGPRRGNLEGEYASNRSQ